MKKFLLPSVLLPGAAAAAAAAAFAAAPKRGLRPAASSSSHRSPPSPTTALGAAPKRLEENAEGVLYVNDRCINCAACANFAPDVFSRAPSDGAHIVHAQPSPTDEAQVGRSRAALAACPVAAIRVMNSAQMNHASRGDRLDEEDERLARLLAINPGVNGLDVPFPRPLREGEGTTAAAVHYLGHHNDKSFGAVPYLATGKDRNGETVSVMVDTPKFTPSALRAVRSLTGEGGPDYLLLTHVDDTADHGRWREEFPRLMRIFHAGDLGRYNWLNDETLEDVEVLLRGTTEEDAPEGQLFKMWALDGADVDDLDNADGDFVVLHTPGHSPGSISLLFRPSPDDAGGDGGGVIFTGDTYAYSTRGGGGMSGFPAYNKDGLDVQARTLRKLGLLADRWDVVAPGHGHPRDYRAVAAEEGDDEDRTRRRKLEEIEGAIEGFAAFRRRFALR